MSDARILDQGYRRYDGPRLGVSRSVRSLAWHSVLRALGLRRTFWAKVLPILSALIAYLPAAVFVGVSALLPDRIVERGGVLPTYHEYYGFITAAIVIFTALVTPEVLCPDRRTGLLGLYLAAPLTRDTYLLAKVLAVLPVLAIVTIGPPLLLLVGLTLEGAGPDGPLGVLELAARIVASGAVISGVYTAVSMAAASLTERRAAASATVILAILVSSVATAVLVELGANEHLLLLNLLAVPFELVQRIYGQPGESPELSTAALAAASVGWTALGALVVRTRYHRLQVTR